MLRKILIVSGVAVLAGYAIQRQQHAVPASPALGVAVVSENTAQAEAWPPLLPFLEAERAALDRMLEVARARLKAGRITTGDFQRAQEQYNAGILAVREDATIQNLALSRKLVKIGRNTPDDFQRIRESHYTDIRDAQKK